jgi:hypothetical protein
MSVTIPTPENTVHVTATIHLLDETAVQVAAEVWGAEITYLPSEGPHAALVMAEYRPQPDVCVTFMARMGQ